MQADQPIASPPPRLHGVDDLETYGQVSAVRGLLIEIAGPVGAMSLGGRIDIEIDRGSVPCEVIGLPATGLSRCRSARCRGSSRLPGLRPRGGGRRAPDQRLGSA